MRRRARRQHPLQAAFTEPAPLLWELRCESRVRWLGERHPSALPQLRVGARAPERGPGTVPAMDGGAAERIRRGIVAFAAGDALGVPWEGRPPRALADAPLESVPARRGGDPQEWPHGCTSDDTEQLLLLAEHLVASGGVGTAGAFVQRLADHERDIRGIGPTSRAALAAFRLHGTPSPGPAPTNGAAMRAPALGWACSRRHTAELGEWTAVLSAATHAHPDAVAAARVVAAMASAGVEPEASVESVLAGAAAVAAAGAVRAALDGRWAPPPAGVAITAAETVAAVVHVVAQRLDLRGSLVAAARLGGDTDTVAAVVGGIVGPLGPDPAELLPWLKRVVLPDPRRVAAAAGGLAALRRRPG